MNLMSFFDPYLTPRDRVKIPKPYCASTLSGPYFEGRSQSYPRVLFAYPMKCRQSFSDNKFTKNVNFALN